MLVCSNTTTLLLFQQAMVQVSRYVAAPDQSLSCKIIKSRFIFFIYDNTSPLNNSQSIFYGPFAFGRMSQFRRVP